MPQGNEHEMSHISYHKSSAISDEVSLYWTIREHGKAGAIDLAVSYRLPRQQFQEDDAGDPSSDFWLGFGLTPQGGMVGADMFLYLPPPPEKDEGDTDSNKADGILLDAHGVAYSFPQADRCGQDWQLVNYTASSTATEFHGVVEVTRALQSHDVNEDLPFLDDSSDILNPTRVIAAWGQIDWMGNQEETNGRRRLGHQKPSTVGTRDDHDGDDAAAAADEDERHATGVEDDDRCDDEDAVDKDSDNSHGDASDSGATDGDCEHDCDYDDESADCD